MLSKQRPQNIQTAERRIIKRVMGVFMSLDNGAALTLGFF
jgi:hypothetical protein